MDREISQAQWESLLPPPYSWVHLCPDCPADNISREDVASFCTAAGGRLPTEAEWEYAARGGTFTQWYCGADESCLGAVAWYFINSGDESLECGTKAPNDYHLYDMLGNVREWVFDYFDPDYYAQSPDDNPQGPLSCPDSNHCVIIRGGSFLASAHYERASIRRTTVVGSEEFTMGGRCVMDIP